MNTEQENDELSALMVGKRYIVYTPTKIPYRGELVKVLEKELLFKGKDEKLCFIPRGVYQVDEVRN